MTSKDYFKINLKYIPIKAHYFFLYGGTGGTVPYMQVFAKEFGISSMAIGIIFTVVPLCSWISKPAFGFITDKLRDIRTILIILLFITGITFFSVLYVPPIRNRKVENINTTATCNEQKNELRTYLIQYDSSCDSEIKDKQYDCELKSHCLKNVALSGSLNVTDSLLNATQITTFIFKFPGGNVSHEDCDCLEHNTSSLTCETNFYKCNHFNKNITEYTMYSFWIFAVLTVISGTTSGTMWSLSDTACNEILGSNSKEYGKQRLWATVSWGFSTLFSGFLNDAASLNSKHLDFSSGFYWMLAFFAVDFLILCLYPMKKTHESINICKNVGKIFRKLKTVTFAVGVYICGAMSGFLWTYQFWFLTDLGSNQLLLGLVAGVQCLLAEVPLFFFSGWFVKKIGHFYCLVLALVAFAIRMGLYSILYNPWWVLPIEMLNGVTYAVFFAAMTLYAVDYAPPGTEATMLGIFGGIFEGIGVATGSFLGGLGFDTKGSRWTFFVASMISLISVPVLTLCNTCLSKSEGKLNFRIDRPISMKENTKYTSHDPIK